MTQYIFVSHSQNDLAKVRKVRDYLEERSFLKCLTDDDELSTLVRREIEARSCFLYLDSPNARVSGRVKAETAYAQEMQKRVFTVNLDASWFMQKLSLKRMMRKMRGYIQ